MVKSECPKEIDNKEWGAEIERLSKNGMDALQNAEMLIYSGVGRGSNHEKISQGAEEAVRFLTQFQKSFSYVTSIINTHKKWLEVVPYNYRATGIELTDGAIIKIHFQGRSPNAKDFSLFYHRENRQWGTTLTHGDLIIQSGMSSHYLEGITDILSVFIESKHFDNLIKKERYEHARSCFDFEKIHKRCDRDKLSRLCNDTTFLNLIQKNNLREVLDSYSVYEQSQTARKTDLRLKSIISKACIFHEMPQPPGAFCKVKDTVNMGERSGIYFGWRNSKCFYVGRSENIEERLRAHHVIRLDDDVSWLEMPVYDTFTNESFYIWLLKPECNGEVKRAERSNNSEDTETTS